jgi:hypothetical protein
VLKGCNVQVQKQTLRCGGRMPRTPRPTPHAPTSPWSPTCTWRPATTTRGGARGPTCIQGNAHLVPITATVPSLCCLGLGSHDTNGLTQPHLAVGAQGEHKLGGRLKHQHNRGPQLPTAQQRHNRERNHHPLRTRGHWHKRTRQWSVRQRGSCAMHTRTHSTQHTAHSGEGGGSGQYQGPMGTRTPGGHSSTPHLESTSELPSRLHHGLRVAVQRCNAPLHPRVTIIKRGRGCVGGPRGHGAGASVRLHRRGEASHWRARHPQVRVCTVTAGPSSSSSSSSSAGSTGPGTWPHIHKYLRGQQKVG